MGGFAVNEPFHVRSFASCSKFVRPFDLGSNEDTESVLSIKNNSSLSPSLVTVSEMKPTFIMSCTNVVKPKADNLGRADLLTKQL